MNNYSEGKIYKIINTEQPGKVYFGATTHSLHMRLQRHKQRNSTCSAKTLFPGGTIELVEEYPCTSKQELEKRERFYIENNECINVVIPGRTCAEYRIANKHKIKEIKRLYYINNQQHLLNVQKTYYENNKAVIKERKKNYYNDNKEHFKEYYQQNKEAISIKYKNKRRLLLEQKVKDICEKYENKRKLLIDQKLEETNLNN